MTTQERAKVVSVISRKIRENGSLRLNQLSRVLVRKKSIAHCIQVPAPNAG